MPAPLRWPDKDPADVLDFTMDFAAALGADTIATVTWTVPADLSKGAETNSTTAATVWLSAGAAGTDYSITCRITTAGGRTIERTALLLVKDL